MSPTHRGERFDRVQKMRHAYVLGFYLKRGGDYRWQTFMKGDGSSTLEGMLRITVDVDHSGYWRTWGEVARRKGWPL